MARESSIPAMSSSMLRRRLTGVVVEEQEIQDEAKDWYSPVYLPFSIIAMSGQTTYLDSGDQCISPSGNGIVVLGFQKRFNHAGI